MLSWAKDLALAQLKIVTRKESRDFQFSEFAERLFERNLQLDGLEFVGGIGRKDFASNSLQIGLVAYCAAVQYWKPSRAWCGLNVKKIRKNRKAVGCKLYECAGLHPPLFNRTGKGSLVCRSKNLALPLKELPDNALPLQTEIAEVVWIPRVAGLKLFSQGAPFETPLAHKG